MASKQMVVDWDLARRRLDGPAQMYLVLLGLVIPTLHIALHHLVFTVRPFSNSCCMCTAATNAGQLATAVMPAAEDAAPCALHRPAWALKLLAASQDITIDLRIRSWAHHGDPRAIGMTLGQIWP